MITETNFRELLLCLGFNNKGDVYEKKFPDLNASMSVDFSQKRLFYPDAIKGRERNNTFNAPENFVVFECVNRLLNKGYRPEHIELEKEWHLGHDAKSGRADICVADTNNSMLFIIECKTYGKEFDKALNDTKNDGAQLFSYWQQEQSCKWLILYASNFKDSIVEYKAPTIDCSDDANILLLAKNDKSIKLYCDAQTVSERYEVWKETYANKLHDDLVFSDESTAYKIGIPPLRKKNLRNFTSEDKIANKFEEILRHNNVSDRENAFNRLIALFICKLVDESTKNEDDEMEFQYKQGTDTYETLQDRLQRLHCDGMKMFMHEEIYYVPADYPERLFSTYTGAKRKKAIEDLQNTIQALKFYSNNDFAFKDVHNKELFYQNGKILVEMVQLFEKYKIVYTSKQQFLGDLFEQLLNKGFKQNEGQFFTPMPITRFIWDSLPVERMLESERGTVYPKIIDYACGAGHFLTEAVEAINSYTHTTDCNTWVKDYIYGIEKDYRLARVAKISLFMNGAGEGNIIFGDGLENAPDVGIENGTFDILVANPPYSVKDFKQHLQLKNNSFTLLDRIGLNSGEIETLFVERIVQLLKPQGIAAVILPSSIFSNDTNSYIGARELILQNFYIRAIVAFGSKTFGATGTNTVVMFLEKFNEPPKQIDLSTDSADAILSGRSLVDWKDEEIFSDYTAQIGVDKDVYMNFISRSYSFDELTGFEYFNMYEKTFAESQEAKNLQKTKAYKNKSTDEQAAAYLEKLYDYIHSVEREKLLYFSLVYQQKTLIITSPTDNKAQKEFLGYDWSNRKGNEGIQIITSGGKLYDDTNRSATGTLAYAIKQSFNEDIPALTEEQQNYATLVNTKDMLSFSRVNFNKAINLTNRKIVIKSKYPIILLKNFTNDIQIQKGTSLTLSDAQSGNIKVIAGGKTFAYYHNEYNRSENVITISASGANAGYVNYWDEKIFASDCTTIQCSSSVMTKFLYYYFKFLQNEIMLKLQKGSSQPHVYKEDIEILPVPQIDETLAKAIVTKCEAVDKEYEATRMSIETYRKKTEDMFNELDVVTGRGGSLSLSNPDKFDVSIGKRVLDKDLVFNGNIPVYSANVFEPFGYTNNLLITDFTVSSVLWGIDGDWMTRYIPKDTEFYPTDHCGVLRCKTSEVNPRYLAHLLETEGQKAGFSRSYRASIDRIKGITFTVPDINLQNKIVHDIEAIEQQICTAEKSLETLSDKTADIIKKYLN